MAERGRRDLAVGAMFALGLLTLALAVMAVGGDSGWFQRRVRYEVAFTTADGLIVGAPVKMAGVTIGTVGEIVLPTDPAEVGIRAELSVDPRFLPRIREDSRAALRILQLLTNEKFVEITPGASGAVLEPGSRIELQSETGMMERGEMIAEQFGQIAVSLNNILARLEHGEGLIGQMLVDPEFGREGLEALGRTLENAQQISSDVRAGRGVVGRLLYDEKLARTLDEFAAAVKDLAALTEAVGGEGGALVRLLGEGGAIERAAGEIENAAAGLNRVVQRLEDERGLVGRLLHDPEFSDAVATDLRSALADMAEITDKINRGQGTLGALVNERVLYDGAEDVLAGVNDSKFARWLLRHYQKKGIEAAEEPPPPPQGAGGDSD